MPVMPGGFSSAATPCAMRASPCELASGPRHRRRTECAARGQRGFVGAAAEAAMRRAARRARRRAEEVARAVAGVREQDSDRASTVEAAEAAVVDPRTLTFSQAQGHERLPSTLKLQELPREARTRIWNLFYELIQRNTETDAAFGKRYLRFGSSWRQILKDIHRDYHVRPLDEWHADPNARTLQQDIQSLPFCKVFDRKHSREHSRGRICGAIAFSPSIKSGNSAQVARTRSRVASRAQRWVRQTLWVHIRRTRHPTRADRRHRSQRRHGRSRVHVRSMRVLRQLPVAQAQCESRLKLRRQPLIPGTDQSSSHGGVCPLFPPGRRFAIPGPKRSRPREGSRGRVRGTRWGHAPRRLT